MYDKTGGDEIESMVGDTNLFLSRGDDSTVSAEVEIMIAEKWARGKKLGWEAICLMMDYGMCELNVNKFEAKIKTDNEASIKMFKKLGFAEASRSEVFSEITYLLANNDLIDFKQKSAATTSSKNIACYQHE